MKKLCFYVLIFLSTTAYSQLSEVSIKGYNPGMTIGRGALERNGFCMYTNDGILPPNIYYTKNTTFGGYSGVLEIEYSENSNIICSVYWIKKGKKRDFDKQDAENVMSRFNQKYDLKNFNKIRDKKGPNYYDYIRTINQDDYTYFCGWKEWNSSRQLFFCIKKYIKSNDKANTANDDF